MDFDPRDDRLGPIKLARTDTFPLKMQIANNGILGSLVRGNSMVSDCRLGCSPTSSTTSDGALMGNDANYMGEARLMRNDSMVSYAGSAPRTMAYHHQALPFKSSGLPLAMSTYAGVHEGERGLEHVVFTANQLRELQLHALIFKHMMCGVNVPPELVLPIRTSVAALAGMTTGAHHIASIGWGNYHLGYGNSIDPEPGRCRRTDGKKWRCSRDVVPDQKYCERHMHRGRHRARKPPEAQSTVASTITSSSGAAQPPAASLVSSPSSAVSMAAARAAVGANSTSTPAASCLRSSSFALQQQQQSSASGSPGLGVKSFSGSSNSPNSGVLSIGSSIHGSNFQQQLALQTAGIKDYRYISGDLCQEQTFFSDARGLSQESPTLSGLSVISSAVNNPLRAMQPKQQQHSFLGSGFDVGRESEGQPLRHFFDDWPRGRDPASLTWSDVEDDRSNRSSSTTQLSISIPMASTDFPSNGSSPRGKLALSPLKLSMSRAGEDDPLGVEAATQMGLGVGLGVNEAERHRQQQSSWVPITWESSSVGGPLAEVLQSSSNTPRGGTGGPAACKSSGLNLMTDAWESSPRNSPPIASSPTGVLQINATFGSFSDTSTASSPRSAALKGPEPSTQL